MPERVCVLTSGGLDSAVLVGVLARRQEVHPVYVRCGLAWERAEEAALRRFQMAIRHDPDFAPAYFGAAYVCTADGKFDDAIKYYRETLKRDTLYVLTYANLGYALLQKGQFPEAVQMLDKALEIDPKCGEAHLCYAKYYTYKRDWNDAENR